MSIDTTNIIAKNVTSPYTATQNCFIVGIATSPYNDPKLDGVTLYATSGASTPMNNCGFLPMRKGQTLSNFVGGSGGVKVFGIKYN